MTPARNHEPDQQGIWFTYTGFRYKDLYNIKLHSGDILTHMFPNGGGWYPDWRSDAENSYRDEEVAEVLLLPDEELHEFCFTGEERIRRNLEMFDDAC